MARFLGVDIPDNKRAEIALTYVHGIGRPTALKLVKTCKISENVRVKDLTDNDFSNLRAEIEKLQLPVEGELRRIKTQNIRRLQEIRSYRGERHKKGLPVRGQKTRTNSRTRKGKKKTVGGTKKKLAKK